MLMVKYCLGKLPGNYFEAVVSMVIQSFEEPCSQDSHTIDIQLI